MTKPILYKELERPVVRWCSDEYTLSAEVFPFGVYNENWRTSIDVHRHQRMFGGSDWDARAEINWPAIGSQDTHVTREFAQGLRRAVEIAEQMNAPVETYKVVLDVQMAEDGERCVFERLIAANNLNQVLESIRQGVDSDGNIVKVEFIEPV